MKKLITAVLTLTVLGTGATLIGCAKKEEPPTASEAQKALGQTIKDAEKAGAAMKQDADKAAADAEKAGSKMKSGSGTK